MTKITMKKPYLYLIIAAVIVAAIVLSIAILSKKTGVVDNAPLSMAGISGAQAHSYASAKYPEIRPDDKIFGNASAPLKMFVYEDYSNTYSARLADTLEKIKAESGDKVAIIIRPYVANSPLAGQAQIAVDCAGDQGKWMEMRALLFAQAKNQQLSAANFKAYADQIGLDSGVFTGCLTNTEKSVKIEQSAQEAEAYSVQGAPTIFVGDELILGARPYEDFTDSNGDQIEGLKTVIDRKLQ